MTAPGGPAGPAGPPRATPAGTIYDIGYRRYTGPRLPSGYALRTLATEGLLGAFGLGRGARAKILPILLLALLTGTAVVTAVVTGVTGASELPLRPPVFVFFMLNVVAIFAASQAPQLVSRDQRFRLLSLYFSRPLTRGQYLVAKVTAMTGAIFVFLAIPLTALGIGGWLAELPWRHELADYGRGLVTALITALLLGAVALFVAAITPRRGIGVAAIIAVFLVTQTIAGILTTLGRENGRPGLEHYAGLVSPSTLVNTLSAALVRVNVPDLDVPGARVGLVYGAVTLGVVLLCYLGLALRYRRVDIS